MTKITIITLTLNSKRTIKDNIKSVNNQSYKNIEHLCIDTLSKDGTYEILKKNKKKNRKILKSEVYGVYRNLNRATNIAKGGIIGVLHSDDIFYNNQVLKSISKKFKNKNINIIYTDIVMVKKNDLNYVVRNWKSNSILFSKLKNSNDYKLLLKNGWMPPHTGFFFRKKIFRKFKYNEKYEISADYDFMIKLLKNINGIYYLPIKSTKMRMGGRSNLISKLLKKSSEDLEIIKNNKIGGSITLIKKISSKIKQFYQ